MDDGSRNLAGNVRRLRGRAGLSVVELARRSGLGRATLTKIEAGNGNPTLETLYALANQLGTPLAELIAEPSAGKQPRVLRCGQGPHTSGETVEAWLLHRHDADELTIEIYAITIHAGDVQRSAAHPTGTREHLHLHSGRVLIGPVEAPLELAAGDYADYPADAQHVYQRLGRNRASATLTILTPSNASLLAAGYAGDDAHLPDQSEM